MTAFDTILVLGGLWYLAGLILCAVSMRVYNKNRFIKTTWKDIVMIFVMGWLGLLVSFEVIALMKEK